MPKETAKHAGTPKVWQVSRSDAQNGKVKCRRVGKVVPRNLGDNFQFHTIYSISFPAVQLAIALIFVFSEDS